jgi:membrane associated rhomboid family serine protease
MSLTINLSIVIITVLVSLGGFRSSKIIDDLIFYPPAISQQNQWYRFFSCGLIHAGMGHLFFNMLALFLFGDMVEKGFVDLFGPSGKWIYLAMYVSALMISLLPTYLKNKNNAQYKSLGASGAVSAVVFAGLMLAPTDTIYVYFIPMPGFLFAPLYLLFSVWMGRRGGDNINHSAHLWGSLYGLAFIILACLLIDVPIVQNSINEIQGYIMKQM